jgi:hypothetical protein
MSNGGTRPQCLGECVYLLIIGDQPPGQGLGFPRYGSFSVTTGKVFGKLDKLVTLLHHCREPPSPFWPMLMLILNPQFP